MASRLEINEELSEICNRLWELDENRCEPGEHYEVDLQGFVKSSREISRRDWACEHLFTWMDEDKVFEMPTYKAFRALLDNYEAETGQPEEVTELEFKENCHFINLIMETAVMKEAHKYLVEHDKAPEEVDDFKRLLYKIWFKLYRRTRGDRDLDSSGFEHVFVGESRQHDVIGFHNWIQFYLQEKNGHIDYKGYFRRGTSNEDQPRLITLQFVWKKDSGKPIGSSFIGTSPEFEMALYSLLFLMNAGDHIPVQIADYEVEMVVYRLGKGLGSAFPISKTD